MDNSSRQIARQQAFDTCIYADVSWNTHPVSLAHTLRYIVPDFSFVSDDTTVMKI